MPPRVLHTRYERAILKLNTMRQIVLDLAVTLDGFIEGPNGEIDWCIIDEGPDFAESDFGKFLQSVDTVFYGRVSYELWGNYQPDYTAPEGIRSVFESVHGMKKYVFSKTVKSIDGNATVIDGNLAEEVSRIRNQPGKDIWLYGGGKLITSFMNLGLVDVFRLAVHPVILGAGKPLFDDIRSRNKLKLVSAVTTDAGVVVLTYQSIPSGVKAVNPVYAASFRMLANIPEAF
jgi:dihydrofolate reductase